MENFDNTIKDQEDDYLEIEKLPRWLCAFKLRCKNIFEKKEKKICIYKKDVLQMIKESKKDIKAQNRMKEFLDKIKKGEIILPEDRNLRIFPWNEVLDCKDFILSSEYCLSVFPECPQCSDNLIWIYFKSPSWTWAKLCGRAGFLSICPHCIQQIDFYCHVMN